MSHTRDKTMRPRTTGISGRLGNLISGFCPNTSGIGNRIGLLFAALCIIKLLMLVGMRKQLFEEHWRVANSTVDWTYTAAFWVFGLLVGANLWVFGNHCRQLGNRAIHVANALVLLLGTLFVLLTFHSGDRNYLYLVMHRILGWRDLGWNLRLNFFFQWPYVAAWVLVYAFVYYFLVRTKRSHLLMQITAIFAGGYVLFCLGDLRAYRDELVAADCLGFACLVTSRDKLVMHFRWLCLPWLVVGFVYFLFRGFAVELSTPAPEFILLTGGSLVLFTGVSLLAWKRGFYAAWSWLLPFFFFGFLLLVNKNYSLAANYNNLLCLGLWLPRYFLGEFGLAFILLVVACGYRKVHPRGSLWWLDGVNLILITLALLDFKLARIMGVRLDYDVLAFGDSPKMMWRMAQPYLPSVVADLAGIVILYGIALWLSGRWRPRAESESSRLFERRGVVFGLLAFVTLGVAGNQLMSRDKAQGESVVLLLKTSPLWKMTEIPAMDLGSLTTTMQELGMGNPKAAVAASPTAPRRDLNVVLIFQESSYNKYLSLFGGTEETEPLLSQYKDRMELFPNFFSDFASSIYARFAAFSGLYPVRNFHAFTLERIGVESIFEALHDQGYTCSMFYSSFFDYTAFRDFLRGRGLDEMYDADTMPGQRKTEPVTWGLHEEETMGAIQDRIKKYATEGNKFFLTYIPAAPHYPYDSIPSQFRKHKMTEYGNYEPAYLNELLYMDWVIASILDELKTNGLLDKTLVVITADHGELLGINGGPIGHGWAVTPELANVPLIILDPDKPEYRVNHTVGSEVDLLPTILDALRLPVPDQQIYQGRSLFDSNARTNRLIYLNSFRQYAIVQGQRIICGDRESESKRGAGISQMAFEIVNDGAHSTFMERQDVATDQVPSISKFDSFQENFLRNYIRYCQMVWQSANRSP